MIRSRAQVRMRREASRGSRDGTRCYAVAETELGWVGLMRSGMGLCGSTLPVTDPIEAVANLEPNPSDEEVDAAEFAGVWAAITSQLAGQQAGIPEPIDLSGGTVFQRNVWSAVRRIPFGQTRSYSWVAGAIDMPLAAHAVGQAVARNPLPLIVPCHRVVAADGRLGGFGRGLQTLAMKRSLLLREGVRYPGPTAEQQPSFVAVRARRPATGGC